MKRIIQISVSKSGKYYVAEGMDLPVITQAKTLDELTKNIKEVIELYLEGEDLTELDISPSPSILLNYELPTSVHA